MEELFFFCFKPFGCSSLGLARANGSDLIFSVQGIKNCLFLNDEWGRLVMGRGQIFRF